MPRQRYAKQSLGTTYTKIKQVSASTAMTFFFDIDMFLLQSRVLLVGAGGIGCELLKNLVLTGFGTIVIVDLDTIDLSNLNRQFLFRQEHIKKSKALVSIAACHGWSWKLIVYLHQGCERKRRQIQSSHPT